MNNHERKYLKLIPGLYGMNGKGAGENVDEIVIWFSRINEAKRLCIPSFILSF